MRANEFRAVQRGSSMRVQRGTSLWYFLLEKVPKRTLFEKRCSTPNRMGIRKYQNLRFWYFLIHQCTTAFNNRVARAGFVGGTNAPFILEFIQVLANGTG